MTFSMVDSTMVVTNASPIATVLPTGTQVGDLLFLQVSAYNDQAGSAGTAPTISTPAGWTAGRTYTVSNNTADRGYVVAHFYRRSLNSAPSVTVTFNLTDNRIAAAIFSAWRVMQVSPFAAPPRIDNDATDNADGGGGNLRTLTAPAVDCLMGQSIIFDTWVAAMTAGTLTLGGGAGTEIDFNNGSLFWTTGSYILPQAVSQGTRTATTDVDAGWAVITDVIEFDYPRWTIGQV